MNFIKQKFYSLVSFEVKAYENLQFGEKDYKNGIAKVTQLRVSVGDKTLYNYFIRIQRKNNQILCQNFKMY